MLKKGGCIIVMPCHGEELVADEKNSRIVKHWYVTNVV